MNSQVGIKRTALLVGGTGLVGRALLSLLLASDRYRKVHLLVRRVASNLPPSAKLKVQKVDFAQLPSSALPAADDVFIALGTTIKVAGSEHAFRQVDFDYVVNIARGALAVGAKRIAVVSAMGADPRSRVFYNRVKGEMEAAVAQLGYETVVIAQPSLLVGDRARLGAAGAPCRRLGDPLPWPGEMDRAEGSTTDQREKCRGGDVCGSACGNAGCLPFEIRSDARRRLAKKCTTNERRLPRSSKDSSGSIANRRRLEARPFGFRSSRPQAATSNCGVRDTSATRWSSSRCRTRA